MIKRKFIKSLLVVFFVSLLSLSIGIAITKAKTTIRDIVFEDANYAGTYSIGDSITIKKLQAFDDEEELEVYAVMQKDLKVIQNFTFKAGDENYFVSSEGEYAIVYVTFDTYGYRHTKSYSFVVGDYDRFDVNLQAEYSFGQYISTDIMAIIDGEKVVANVSVKDPNGMAVDLSEGGFYPSVEGEYLITLKAEKNGIKLEKKHTFIAYDGGITDLFIAEKNIKSIDANINSPAYAIPDNGIRIMASRGDVAYFRYKNIIDLNNISKEENIIKILPLSTEDYTLTSEIHVRLVDIYDESNVVEYFAYPMYYPYYPGMPDWSHCYVNYDGRTLARNNDGDHNVRNNYGSTIPTHFNGQMLDGTMRTGVHWIELQVDYPESQFLCLGYAFNPVQYCILDIDDSNQVGLGKEWEGFTTGEVYMEINFLAEGDNSGVLISEIAGQKFSGSEMSDKTAPSILFDGLTDQAPNATVNVAYEIPQPRIALDLIDGKLALDKVEVMILKRKVYGYYEDVTHLYDGTKFVADTVGDYIIRYLLEDKHGNQKITDLALHVGEKTAFKATIDMQDTYYVGQTFMLSEVVVDCYTSLIEKEVKYLFNNQSIDESAYEDVMFSEEGTLTIEYRFVAYGGEELSGSKIINIVIDEKPVITSEGTNQYVIKGAEIILPTFDAIDYSKPVDSKERYPEKYYLVNGKRIEYSDKRYQVTENAGEMIHIQAVSKTAVKDFYVTVVEPKYLSDYFVYDNQEVVELNTKDALKYQFSKDTTFEFINPLIAASASGVIIELGLDSQLETNKAFRIVLTDFYNETETIYLDVTYRNGNYYLELNGNGRVEKANSYIKNGETYLSLNINNISDKITGVFGIDYYANGKIFDGFKSNLIKLKVIFSNVEAETGFCIYSLAGKSFDSYFDDDGNLQEYEDISMPSIVFNTSLYDQLITYGKKIVIPDAQAWSVLSGRYEVKVTVKSPTNRTVLNAADASIVHEVVLDEYGEWYVQYQFVSSAGLKKNHTLTISAQNDNKPVYTVDNEPKASYSVGDEIKIPVIKSNEEITVNIAMINSSGKYIYVNEGSNFKLEEKGIYRLMIYINNGYHYTMEFYEFEVK